MSWLAENWELVAAAAVALLSILNRWLSKHPDDYTGVKRLLAWVLDWVAVLQSKDSEPVGPRGLRVKLPVLQVSPPRERKGALK